MFYIDENLLADSRALITVNKRKSDISRILKVGMINYTTADGKLWLTNDSVRKNVNNPLANDMLDRIITAKNGLQIEDSFNFMDDQTFMKNVTVKKDLLIEGNLKVLGESTVIDTPSLSIEDNVIELNRNETGNGITLGLSGTAINRGDLNFARFLFEESSNSFILDKSTTIDGETTYCPIRIFLEDGQNFKAGDVKVARKIYSPFIEVNDTLDVKNLANLKNLNVEETSTIAGTLTVSATSLFNSLVNVKGECILDGAVNINGVLTVNNTATIKETALIEKELTVNKGTTLNDTVNVTKGGINIISGDANIHDNLEVKKNANILKNLKVDGVSRFVSEVTMEKSLLAKDITSETDIALKAGNGNGYKFWNSDSNKIYMNETDFELNGANDSLFNMYFKIGNENNDGYIFMNGETPIAQIEGRGVLNVKDDIYSKQSLVLTKAMEGEGNGIDADTVDGKHASDIVLRDGSNSMIGDLNVDDNRIIWGEGNSLQFLQSGAINGIDRSGIFKLIGSDNISNTALETGALKIGEFIIDGKDNGIHNIEIIKSKDGEILKVNKDSISINKDGFYNIINFNSSTLRTDGAINIGVGGNILLADNTSFEYKGENVLTTSGTKFMNGDINMKDKKLRFASSITGRNSDNLLAEIYAEHGEATKLNITVGKNINDEIAFNKIDGSTIRKLLSIKNDHVTFSDNPYHNGDRLLTVADIGHGNELDADTVDGKHYNDLVQEFVNVNGDTISGDLFFSGNSKIKIGSENTFINKTDDLNINSEDNIILTADSTEFKVNINGTVTLNGDKLITVADEGEGNSLDSDTVDGVHANQFVRRDIKSTMEADLEFGINKILLDGCEILKNSSGVAMKNEELSLTVGANSVSIEKGIDEKTELLKIDEGNFLYNNNTVWNSGNLTPELYEKINPEIIEDSADIDSFISTNKYICKNVSGIHSIVNTESAFIEVISEASCGTIQRVSCIKKNCIIQRVMENNEWGDWTIIAGKQHYSKEVDISNWNEELGMFYIDVTHDLIYKGISAVTLIDAEGFSMFTGFKELNESIIRVYSSNRIAGKVAINVTLN